MGGIQAMLSSARKRYPAVWLACLIVLAATAANAHSAGLSKTPPGKKETSDTKVKAKVEAGKVDADGKQTVLLILEVEKGWHIYANPVNHDIYGRNATTVGIKTVNGAPSYRVSYPEGKVKKEEKDTYNIYEGAVQIPIVVERANLADALQISVQVNACNDRKCLDKGIINLTVK
jgi:DsbC/DsbD-like thiol-disulfide interchange protein